MEYDIREMVQRHLPIFYEIEATDVQFRRELDAAERRQKPPWIMSGRTELQQEEHALWKALDEGSIDDAEMVRRTVLLMEIYYGVEQRKEMSSPPSYRDHVGSIDLADIPRVKQNELIRVLFTQGTDYRDWVISNDVKWAQSYGLACITHAVSALAIGDMYDDPYSENEGEPFRDEQIHEAIDVIAGTKLWLRLEEAFPPFEKTAAPNDYDWKEMERFAEIGGLEPEEARELVNHLEKVPDPPDGMFFRLPHDTYKEGWKNGSLSLYVDRGLATQIYQRAKPSWAHSLPLVFVAGLFAFIPVMIFVGVFWGLVVLAAAIIARKILSSKAVNWVREDSLSDLRRYRLYSARKIVWAQKVQDTVAPS